MTSPILRLAGLAALLAHVSVASAHAQTNEDRGSFAIREMSVATGYAFVQLPPITLGGHLPADVLAEDLVSSAAARIDWQRITAFTRYRFELSGAYSARTRYSRLNAPGGSAAFGVSRSLGRRWRLGAGAASAIVGSDQVVYQQTRTRRAIDRAVSLDDLAEGGVLARSPNPDPAAASLFVPISQTLSASDLYTNRVLASSADAEASYTHSAKLTTYFHGRYTDVRWISSSRDDDTVLPFPDSRAEGTGARLQYRRSARTAVTAAVNWSRASGVFTHEGVSTSVGYAWLGKRWLAEATIGTLLPFETAGGPPQRAASGSRLGLVYGAALGYSFRTQTFLAQYRRAPHDDYGNGGRNVETGFEGDVQSLAASWSWSQPRRRWLARADFSLIRRPGNFSSIYAWLATAGLGRQIRPNLRLMGEVVFDRHGSRGFEGFALTREGVRLNLVWTPPRRGLRAADAR